MLDNVKIQHRLFNNGLFIRKKADKRFGCNCCKRKNNSGEDYSQPNCNRRNPVNRLCFFFAPILRGDNRHSRGNARCRHVEEKLDVVAYADTAECRFAVCAHHYRVCKINSECDKILSCHCQRHNDECFIKSFVRNSLSHILSPTQKLYKVYHRKIGNTRNN